MPSTPTISAGSATTFCQGGSVTLTASTASSYLWSNAATTQSISVSSAGNYSVVVTNANGCSAPSSVTGVIVNPLPSVPIISASDTTFCQGGSAILTASTASAYLWSNGATTQSTTILTAGDYSVTATNSNGCSASATQTINVNVCTGIVELTGSLVSIYPNPATEQINIKLDASFINNATIEVYDVNGKMLLSEKVLAENTSIVITTLSNGIYTLKIVCDSKKIVHRFIKE